MAAIGENLVREQLLFRRERLDSAIRATAGAGSLARLMEEVDAALARLDDGSFGLCATCHDPIEADRLAADPLVQYCLDHLTPGQRLALQQDLDLASHIQGRLLPQPDVVAAGWEISYHYEAAGAVSGDYCDLPHTGPDNVFFLVGDVSGKGVAASMLVAQLHATFRSLTADGPGLDDLMGRVNRLFCENTPSTHYATLVCGRAHSHGEVEICNAGHCPPLAVCGGEVTRIESTGLPLGLFCEGQFPPAKVRLATGDSLLLYTDGLTEARSRADEEFGEGRLLRLLRGSRGLNPRELTHACVGELCSHLEGARPADDVTIMALRRM